MLWCDPDCDPAARPRYIQEAKVRKFRCGNLGIQLLRLNAEWGQLYVTLLKSYIS